jgi:hypothetical protein
MWRPSHSSNQLQTLDLCLFGATKKLIARINKLEKVNVQVNYIVRVVDGLMAAAVPHNIVPSFRNTGVSLLLNDDHVIRCMVTQETTRCILGAPFLACLPIPEEEEEDLEMLGYIDQVRPRDVESGQGERDDNPLIQENSTVAMFE